ncbi:MAG TPA: hypothetical protein VHY48_12715 [Acidobacteriaceae bacterium]|jgi:lipopolysaccharide export system protein LptA|nr:hypothetical protein [Acidobacteriaceae bacterium]
MRLWVERLRWGLLVGALVLLAVVVALMGYGRYRAVKAWRNIVARSGATITHETNGVTWSQALKGHTVFVLHAAKAVPQGGGRYSLHDAVLVLYDRAGVATDRIAGAEFEYDEKAGVAKAMGQVHMDLEPPSALSSTAEASGQAQSVAQALEAGVETPQTIHVLTSRLVYVRKLGVAATDQEVEIAYQGIHGYARGAEFDSGQSVVHLLADVRAEGVFRGQAATLNAAKADLDRSADVIRLMQPVIRSAGRTASAEAAVLSLRNDGSLGHVHASGAVTLRVGTRTMKATTLEAALNAKSLVEHAEFSGGVAAEDSDPARPMQGAARTVTIVCDRSGAPSHVAAEGGVTVASQARGAGGVVLHREMAAERVTFALKREGRRRPEQVSAMEATGSAWMRGESVVAAADAAGSPAAAARRGTVKTTELAADDMKLAMRANAAGKDEPQRLTGTGHTRLTQRMPDGAVESSTGDSLEAQFAARAAGAAVGGASAKGGQGGLGAGMGGGFEVVSAEQSGHVAMREEPATAAGAKKGAEGGAEVSTGTAERAVWDGRLDEVTLYGRPQLERGDTSVTAETIALAEQTGDAVARGAVEATFANAKAAAGSPVTHAMAASAVLHKAAGTVEFHGTDAQPARMWQGASQLEAASIVLDRAHDTLVARPGSAAGLVHVVFASSGTQAAGAGGVRGAGGRAAKEQKDQGAGSSRGKEMGFESSQGGPRVMRITSARLDYSGASGEAVFGGGVRSEAEDGLVKAQRGVVFLSTKGGPAAKASASGAGKAQGEPDLLGGSVEKIVLSGDVRMEQPGRRGTGEQLLYTAATGEFVLTGGPGRPPHVVDAKQGSITGATLLFRSPDSTIIVAGEPGAHGQSKGRVHTETEVKP